MKKLLLISVPSLLCLILSCGSTVGGARVNAPVTYSEVIDVTGVSQSILYTKANLWFVDTFRNAASVIQFSDKESGIIKGKYTSVGIFVGSKMMGEYLTFYSTITVEIREGRYKISFSDPLYRNTGNYFGGPNSYPRVYPEKPVTTADIASVVLDNWKEMAASLKSSILAERTSW